MTSQAGLKLLQIYFNTTGFTALNDANAPLLNYIIYDPLDVPPSGKMQIGGYYPRCSIICYLSPICSTTLFLFSTDAPREIKIQPNACTINPKTGNFLKVFLEAKAALKCEINIGTSNQDE